MTRLKHCARLITAKAESRCNPLALENIESWTGRLIPSEGDYQGEGTAFGSGDILFGKLRPYLAKVHLAERPGEAVGDFHVLRPEHSLDGRFAQYGMLTRGFIGIVDGSTYGSMMPRASWEFVGGMPIALPASCEQPRIAAFLDHETAKIDTLIAEQQRLIELLQEKRQAVISHAVTKGLNPDAPIKDSRIEWLGEVPEHWEVRRVKTVSSFTTSGPRGWSERVGEDGALFVQSGDLDDAMGVDFANCKRVQVGADAAAEAVRTQLQNGDVVTCVTGAKTGNVAVCSTVPEVSYVNQHVCLIRPTEHVRPQFLGMLLKSGFGQTYFSLAQYGLKQGLSLEDVREAPVLMPPLAEQQAIIDFVREQASRSVALVDQAERSIALLQERRSALISAAVTGQIDVRGISAGGGAEAA